MGVTVRSVEKRLEVRQQQEPIAEWMHMVLGLKGWTATKWAREAGVGRDTVSRAIRDDYEHVTSTTTLLKLAKAAGVPAPLHLGAGAEGVPSVDALAEILDVLLAATVPGRDWQAELIHELAKTLRHTLLVLAEDDGETVDPAHARGVARGAALRRPE